jgi:transposase
VTYPSGTGPHQTLYKRFTRWEQDGTWARIEAVLQADADAEGISTGRGTWTPPPCVPTSTPLAPPNGLSVDDAQRRDGLSRSRGGLSTKIHTVCEGNGRDLATHITPGQDSDTRELVRLLDAVAVSRPGGSGRPRSRLSFLCGDKGYSSAANRRALRRRKIPQPSLNAARRPTGPARVPGADAHPRSTQPATATGTGSSG